MTDPQLGICEILGEYAPLFNIYSSLLYEKAVCDLSELSVCGKKDRFSFVDSKTGFLNYIISKERTEKIQMLNKIIAELFSLLLLMLGNKKELLLSCEKVFLFDIEMLEKEAYDVYNKAFYDDV